MRLVRKVCGTYRMIPKRNRRDAIKAAVFVFLYFMVLCAMNYAILYVVLKTAFSFVGFGFTWQEFTCAWIIAWTLRLWFESDGK